MKEQIIFNKWIQHQNISREIKEELLSIKDNNNKIKDRFYKDLEFGTGGLRGIIGAGTNRINIYTIAKATRGIGEYILSLGEEGKGRGVVIAYDSRHMSRVFAKQTALVLCAIGIKTYLFDDLRPTPELSFAVRYLKATAGVVITASHNPPEYNGYKVYWEDGGQITDQLADELIVRIKEVNDYLNIEILDEQIAEERNLLHYIGEEIDTAYINKIKKLSMDTSDKNVKVVYTPIHGTGLIPIRRVLREMNYNNLHILKSQEKPDPNFSTVKSPNPEESEALSLAIEYGKEVDADLVFGTDPDSDRIGIAVKDNNGKYQLLNGNQTGVLLLNYLLKMNKDKLTDNNVLIKTIVTSDLGAVIAEDYGVKTIETLTGFKYIGEKIKEFESTDDNFLFGYEESYGYLTGTFVRDKDAVISAMLLCEMTNYYKSLKLSLLDVLNEIYEKYGYYKEHLQSIKLSGLEGSKRIDKIMNYFRDDLNLDIKGFDVEYINDYKKSISLNMLIKEENVIQLPKSNVLKYISVDGSWFALRPSGTEPKLKIYYSVRDVMKSSVDYKLEQIKAGINHIISIIE
ncbi:MAG: phospho-sugar mutase [Eubacteriaceae bacterium]